MASTNSPASPIALRAAATRWGRAPGRRQFHFDPTTTIVLDPAGKLLAQLRVGIAGEPTAAVDRYCVTAATEHRRH
jgi:hypothetical protein